MYYKICSLVGIESRLVGQQESLTIRTHIKYRFFPSVRMTASFLHNPFVVSKNVHHLTKTKTLNQKIVRDLNEKCRSGSGRISDQRYGNNLPCLKNEIKNWICTG